MIDETKIDEIFEAVKGIVKDVNSESMEDYELLNEFSLFISQRSFAIEANKNIRDSCNRIINKDKKEDR